ncbi:MAG: hypothetical protein NTY39_02210 [Campylobacterales bacterium]|nr:hypothetical protein [Campylobacterales bacterium]
MKKRGIVLMMTLILITVMMGIVALMLIQSTQLSKLGNNSFTQSASLRIISDLEIQLPTLLSSITGAAELDLAMRLPLQLESKKKDFILKASLSSMYNRLNINSLISTTGVINDSNIALLMRLFTAHPIADPDIFFKLIFDTIDVDTTERGRDTEIQWSQPDCKNGIIANEKQFSLILARYIELTRDTTILSIPWDKYIAYEGEKMDFNAVNAETLALILPSVPAEKIRSLTAYRTKAFISKEEAIASEPALATVFDTYFFIYKPNTSYTLACDVRLTENAQEEHLKFQYNLLDKKVQRIEFL